MALIGYAALSVDPRLHRSVEEVVRSFNVGPHGLHGEELAGGHLLERRRVEDIVHAGHGVAQGLNVAHIPDIEAHLARMLGAARLQFVAHVVLLLLIAGEDADFANIGGKEAVQNGMTEGAGAAGNHQGLAGKNGHYLPPVVNHGRK